MIFIDQIIDIHTFCDNF